MITRWVSAWYALAALAGAGTTAFGGPVWNECSRPDAGSSRGTAQDTTSIGAVRAIHGCLRGSTARGPGDYEDMFLIKIDNPSTFHFTTGAPDGSAPFDTQVFLFFAGGVNDGLGALANDDISLVDTASFIASPADDGSGFTLPGPPGFYYLAITASNNDPLSASGAIFDQVTATEISGPDGAGAADPIDGWTGPTDPLAFGEYYIAPEPSSLMAVALGGLSVVRRFRSSSR